MEDKTTEELALIDTEQRIEMMREEVRKIRIAKLKFPVYFKTSMGNIQLVDEKTSIKVYLNDGYKCISKSVNDFCPTSDYEDYVGMRCKIEEIDELEFLRVLTLAKSLI